MVPRAAIAATAARIAPHIRRTPVLRADGADFGRAPARLVFKLEFLQHAGSFKARGAFAHLLGRDVPAAGVAAASGGNHGAAVAFAAGRLGVPATIFVPAIAAPAKLARIRAAGARLVVGGERYADALAACDAFVAETGALPIHAYDDAETLLGQGTVGWEMEADAPEATHWLVAVGGGGLLGGICAWFEGRRAVVPVESDGAPTLAHALEAGAPVDAPAGGIAADSLAPRRIGQRGFDLARRFAAPRVALVTDDDIRAAQRALWDVLRVAVEPGGAAAFAAWHAGRWTAREGARVGILLCGANTDAVAFP